MNIKTLALAYMTRTAITLTAIAWTSTACGPSEQDGPLEQKVSIPVQAVFGAQGDFSCTKTFRGLGRGDSTFSPKDFRFYVHDVKLLSADGKETPVVLDESVWQTKRVALLDFEDKTGTCANGTQETNSTITGHVPKGSYTGLSFTLGVPFELNHANQAIAKSPLNISGLWWSWQGGYKFFKLDGATDTVPEGLLFHLGSAGCAMGEGNTVKSCTHDNRTVVTLNDFVPGDTLTLDLEALFQDTHLDQDEGGAKGCMSSPEDPDCAPLFKNLGLPFAHKEASTQSVFR